VFVSHAKGAGAGCKTYCKAPEFLDEVTPSKPAQVIVQEGGHHEQAGKRDQTVGGQAQDTGRTGHPQGQDDGCRSLPAARPR